ncbi:PREDICTED: AT-rich interactive domain-containing protein 3B [Gekko japonicus]|uniref:AT-rich interactive domain-containing protein 3 n=1 Tax=Gekko japonicus TaxID=146911 RepID=A0ABM1K998_GEKJA|nr:PREDICTED: AT-rich interactive domain-containing protein 3B [Gekko japonicus]
MPRRRQQRQHQQRGRAASAAQRGGAMPRPSFHLWLLLCWAATGCGAGGRRLPSFGGHVAENRPAGTRVSGLTVPLTRLGPEPWCAKVQGRRWHLRLLGEGHAHFQVALHARSGQVWLRTRRPLDREARALYALRLALCCKRCAAGPPPEPPLALAAPEDARPGTLLATLGPAARFPSARFELVSPPPDEAPVRLDGDTGEVTLARGLDRETAPRWEIICRVQERTELGLYELDGDPERKKFLDDLFVFMQKRGTPINRIPIMAKQILDLYMLYKLVTEKGGLVEIINKKIWREITKGLNLPTSITSAAFTLRTQYMKYLYAYECEKKSLSSPAELQAAIDGNRREGRRPSYSSSLFGYSPAATGGPPSLLCPPKIRFPVVSLAPSGTTSNPHLSPAAALRKGDGIPVTVSTPNRVAMPVTLANQQATLAARTATLEQLRERLESGEPPEKVSRMTEEEQRFVQQALQRNLFSMARQLPMKIKINGREDKSDSGATAAAALNWTPSGFGSINMSVEINGTIYAGVLFAQKPVVHLIAGSSTQSTGGGGSSSSSSHCSPSPTSSRGTPSAEPSTSWSL